MGKTLWLGIHASTAEGMSLTLGWGTKNLRAAWYSQKKKKKACFQKRKTTHFLAYNHLSLEGKQGTDNIGYLEWLAKRLFTIYFCTLKMLNHKLVSSSQKN